MRQQEILSRKQAELRKMEQTEHDSTRPVMAVSADISRFDGDRVFQDIPLRSTDTSNPSFMKQNQCEDLDSSLFDNDQYDHHFELTEQEENLL